MIERTRYIKFPFRFDTDKLMTDLSVVNSKKWIPHFNTFGYDGEWTVISLYSYNGDENNIFAFAAEDSPVIENPNLKKCPYFKEVIHSFKCSVLSARLLKLTPQSEIKPHRDHDMGYENNNFRIHVPIMTNDEVEFTLDGEVLNMMAGDCWYTNVNYVHSVRNDGDTDRVHLVIDFERNAWSDKLFYSMAPKESFEPLREDIYSVETIERIIKELKLQNEPASEELIHEFEMKLKILKKKA